MKFKQCIVVRDDLKLTPGKLAVQVAHAAILAQDRADKSTVTSWKSEGQKKVVLKIEDLRGLFLLRAEAERLGIASAIVTDAGLTEIPPGTITALGLGPALEKEIDRVTGDLSLL